MPQPSRLAVPLLLCAVLAASPSARAGAGAAAGMSPADGATERSMAAMQRQMASVPMTGDADRDFAAMMIPHHASAIEMARIELQYGRSPELRRMARSIVEDQQREIGEMHAWQASHPNG